MRCARPVMMAATLIMAIGWQTAHGNWTIDWTSLDGGGAMESSVGTWELRGTIGQHDATVANALSGGGWTMTGGFWALVAERLDRIFHDRFQ